MALTLTTTEPNTRPYAPEVLGPVITENNLPGTTFNNGLLRFHNEESGALALENLRDFFGERANELTPFAVDWRGRHFCRVQIEGNDVALRADSAFMEASPLADYQETIAFLLQSDDATNLLEADVMEKSFDALGVYGLKFTDCIGLKVPAFLGGEEEISNFEVNNMDVYWTFNAQVYNKVKDLPPGTPITDINLA
ncbi:T6SS immunity protein Tdi1 domain-containing protein [Falsarthrobacter nasiphocae]|uniref:DUF1851 domain-containing protein n=1 Tax=Falsarthrobacter nasiphocae TaxID=189863 RepID=A0AAE4C6I7_9MICC|nr:T6SS immunity protein Tdi1 domain-containing protein [Falsarthrobacter nasiphocae]MDR6892207.1 hypothetical protein [Falsarthrobacter nasiphocae]